MRFKRWRLPALCALLLLGATACTRGPVEPAIKLLATDPAPGALLGRQQRFYVQFAVTGAAPLVVSLDAYYRGEPVAANLGTSAPVALPAGGGNAVAHLFFWGEYATRVDEVRLTAREAQKPAPRAQLALPVNLAWTAKDAAPREPAPWVREWQQAQDARGKTSLGKQR